VLRDVGGPNLELLAELLTKLRGEIGHLVERRGPFSKEPFPHLSRPIARQPMLDEPVA